MDYSWDIAVARFQACVLGITYQTRTPPVSPNSFPLVLRQANKGCRREKITTPGSQNLACLVRLYSGGQWTIAEAKLERSLCIKIYRRFPFPLCYFIPSLCPFPVWYFIARLSDMTNHGIYPFFHHSRNWRIHGDECVNITIPLHWPPPLTIFVMVLPRLRLVRVWDTDLFQLYLVVFIGQMFCSVYSVSLSMLICIFILFVKRSETPFCAPYKYVIIIIIWMNFDSSQFS